MRQSRGQAKNEARSQRWHYQRRARRGIPSDAVLQHWWRLCVRQEWEGKCALKSDDCQGKLECHHIVKRARPHLKHSPANGILLCKWHHAQAGYEVTKREIRVAVSDHYGIWQYHPRVA